MHVRALFLSCTLAALVPAQERQLPVLGRFSVPLHTAPDDPTAGAYGIWGAGHDYKVSFHTGFRFFPRCGAQARNQPLAWRTEAVRFGDEPLFEGGDRVGGRDGDWRYQFRHPGVVESYELRTDRVEQVFTILAAPATGGDLRISGTPTTELVPASKSWDDAVPFVDETKTERLQLTRATGADARARAVPVRRSHVDGRLELTIAAEDLAGLRYPITVRQSFCIVVVLEGPEYSDVDSVSWIHEDRYLAVTSHWGQADADSYAFMIRASGELQLFWADLNSAWSTERPRLGAAGDWISISGQRTYTQPVTSAVFLYRQEIPPAYGLNLGALFWTPVTPGYTQRNPSLDNSFTTAGTYVTWQEDLTSTNADTQTTRVVAARWSAGSFEPKWIIAEGALFDAEDPVGESGYVFWRHQPNLNFLPAQIYARRIDKTGPASGPILHVSAAHAGAACARPLPGIGPRGWYSRGICAYEFTQGSDRGIAVAMLAVTLDDLTVSGTRELWRSTESRKLHDVAIVTNDCHWHVLYERAGQFQARRLGRTGGTVVNELLATGAVNTACFGEPWSEATKLLAPIYYAHSAVPDRIVLRAISLAADAGASEYGDQCGGRLDATIHAAFVGQGHAGGEVLLGLLGPPPGTTCHLWAAGGSGASPLFGGCTFRLDQSAAVIQTITSFQTPLPMKLVIPLADDPVFFGDLYFQVTWQDPSFPAITRATNGVEVRVR